MTDEEYKTKVLDAKGVVTQMINNAKEKNISYEDALRQIDMTRLVNLKNE